MGSSASSPVPLAPTFQRMSTWKFKSAKKLLQDYKDKDLDFGLDAQALSELLAGDKDWAAEIIDAFSSTNGMGFCVVSGVGAVPSDEDLENVTLSAYRELNKSSGQSISKAEFTKWVMKFAAGDSTNSHSEVTIQSAMEQFGVASSPRANYATACEDEMGNPAGGDDSNPPDQLAIDHLQLETEAEAQSVEASTFDKAYQAHEIPQANDSALEDGALEAFSATEVKFDVSPKETAYPKPEPLQRAQELLLYEENTDEYEETPSFEAETSGEPVEVAHAVPARDEETKQAVMAQPDKLQEDYEQEFAAETPRVAEETTIVAKEQHESDELRDQDQNQAPQEGGVHVEESSSAEQFEAETVGEDSPSAPVSDEVQGESSASEQRADNTNPQAETEETFDEQLPVPVPVQQGTRQEETMTPAPSVIMEKEEESKLLEKQAPAAFEPPELESKANYEDDGYDLPSARDGEAPDVAGAAKAAPPGETSVEAAEIVSPLPASSSEELDENVPKEDATENSGGGVDLNDFEAYDYSQLEYDASNGLPPPEGPADFGTAEKTGADGIAEDVGTAYPDADPDASAAAGDAADEAASASPLPPNEGTGANSSSNGTEEDAGTEAAGSKSPTQELQSEET